MISNMFGRSFATLPAVTRQLAHAAKNSLMTRSALHAGVVIIPQLNRAWVANQIEERRAFGGAAVLGGSRAPGAGFRTSRGVVFYAWIRAGRE